MGQLAWRPPDPADDEAWLALLAALAEAEGPAGERWDVAALAEERASTGARAHLARFGWAGADLVAFAWPRVLPPEAGGPARLSAWGGVHPAHRGRGVGGEVLAHLVRAARVEARVLGAAVVAELEVPDGDLALRALARQAGWARVARTLELVRPVRSADGAGAPPPPAGVRVRGWRPDDDEPARLLHGRAFAGGPEGGPDGGPLAPERWRAWCTGHDAVRPDLAVVAEDGTGALVGLALVAAYPADWVDRPPEAWLQTLAVDPAWWRRGVGAALVGAVLAGVAAASGPALAATALGVDAANPTGAVGLYERAGFVVRRGTTRYEREVGPG